MNSESNEIKIPSAREIRGVASVVQLTSEPPPKLIVDELCLVDYFPPVFIKNMFPRYGFSDQELANECLCFFLNHSLKPDSIGLGNDDGPVLASPIAKGLGG